MISASGWATATLRAFASASRHAVAAGASSASGASSVSRRDGDERDAEAFQQHAAIARRRREHEAPPPAGTGGAGLVLTVVFAGIFDRIRRSRYYPTFLLDWPGRVACAKPGCRRVARTEAGMAGQQESSGRRGGKFDAFDLALRRASVGRRRGCRVRWREWSIGWPRKAVPRRSRGGSSGPPTLWADLRWKISLDGAYRSNASAACSRSPGPSRSARRCCWRATSASSRCSTTRTTSTRSCWRTRRWMRRR